MPTGSRIDCSNSLTSWLSLILTRSGLMDRLPFVRSNGLPRQFRSFSAFLAISWNWELLPVSHDQAATLPGWICVMTR